MPKSKINLALANVDSDNDIKVEFTTAQKALIFSRDDRKQILTDDAKADRIFDKVLSSQHQELSTHQWTSAAVVRKVAQWLGPRYSGKRIVDIGSGVGKFCILLSLQSELEIYGIEQRKSLYEASQLLRNANLLKRITFIQGNMVDLPWEDFDIFYLYNPFQEHLVNNGWSRINDEISFNPGLFGKYIDEIFRELVWAEKGKILITFHGYGGIVPSTWRIVHTTKIKGGDLCMWEKML